MYVRSFEEALLAGFDADGKELWRFNGDHVRRWSAEHRKQLQRWAEDSKAKHCPAPPFAERRTRAVDKYHRRMNTAADKAAAYAIKCAERRKFKSIALETADPNFCPEFPWYRLKTGMATLLGELGSELIAGEEGEKTGELVMAKGQSS